MRTTLPQPPLIGSLCSGYGGLDLGVQAAFGGTLAWHAEVDPNASRILARQWPDVPNLGDITTVNWSAVQQVCVLTAGFPCQRRLGRRPPGRTERPYPLRALASRCPCGRGPPPLPGCDRECARPPHVPCRFPWRRGTLPVVSGRRRRSVSSAGTWCRTRLPGRPRVRREVARASCLRHRGPAPTRADVSHRLARRPPCSRHRPATSARTAAPSTRTKGGAGGTARTWPTRSSGCCRHRRRRTGSKARRTSGTATGTCPCPVRRPRCCPRQGPATRAHRAVAPARGGVLPCRRWSCRSGRRSPRRPRNGRAVGPVRSRHHPMGEADPSRTRAHRRGRPTPPGLRGVDAGPRCRLGHSHPRSRASGTAHRARQRRHPSTSGKGFAVAGATFPVLRSLRGRVALHYRVFPAEPNRGFSGSSRACRRLTDGARP